MTYTKEQAIFLLSVEFREHIFAHAMRSTKKTPAEIMADVTARVDQNVRLYRECLGISDFSYNDVLTAIRRVINDHPEDDTFDYCESRGSDQLCYDPFTDVEPYIALLHYHAVSRINEENARIH